jgi:hypothetical protein
VGAASAERTGGDAAPLIRLLEVAGRAAWYLPGSRPACFLLVDARAGGILVNSPPFDARVAEVVARVAKVQFIFFPSRFGATDVARWRAALAARTVAAAEECAAIDGPIDEAIDGGVRIHGRLDFLALSGRTRGTCALRSRMDPAIVFFGPALEHGDWPQLVAHADDYSYENRLLGAIGLSHAAFEFAFCDNYSHGSSRFGPGAGRVVATGLAKLLDPEA